MKKTLMKGLALAAVGTLFLVGSSFAAMVNGSVGMAGQWEPTGGSGDTLSDATGIDFLSAQVIAADFDLADLLGTNPTMTGFTFNPFPGLGVLPLWTETVGGIEYSFDLENLRVDTQTIAQINLTGTGTLNVTGFDPTPAVWTWTGNKLGSAITWSDSATAVPEPATMLLFGAGLAGLAGVSRRKKK